MKRLNYLKRLNIIIAEAAIETIPPKLIDHPEIQRNSKRRGIDPNRMLLDISYHYKAMKKLDYRWKRGRPDITHITLLNILGSPANRMGYIQTYVHTIGNKTIKINPNTRLPRNYQRFVGLIEQLFRYKWVPPRSKETLLRIENWNLKALLEKIKPSKTIMLTSKGKKSTPKKLIKEILNETSVAIIIGGFPHGDFTKQSQKLADKKYSIYPDALDAWIVASIVIHQYEIALKIFDKAQKKESTSEFPA